MNKGNIMVNNEIVKKKLVPPTVPDILRLTDEELQQIRATKLIAADEHVEKGFEYYSYIFKVKTVKDVKRGMFKARIKHGNATHVSCVYRLEGVIGPYNQEGHDDKEPGTGRTILDVIKKQGLQNICVIIVCYFGGTKLGRRRFDILRDLTFLAISAYNKKARELRARQF